MGYDIYVDGRYTARLGSATDWDAAAAWIERHAAPLTALRRLAEDGKTDRPQAAAAMIVDLLRCRKPPRSDIAHTLRVLYSLLRKGNHVIITDSLIGEC